MTGYNIVPPQEPLIDKDGRVTRSWWRFFNTTFMILGGYQGGGGGGGQPIDLTTLYNLAFAEFSDTSPDYGRFIADLQTVLATKPDDSGPVAALEQRVKRLETLLAAIEPQPDLLKLQRETSLALAVTLGAH